MRATKQRIRLANPTGCEPRMVRDYPLEIGIRDPRTGEAGWVPLQSARHARRLAGVMFNYYL